MSNSRFYRSAFEKLELPVLAVNVKGIVDYVNPLAGKLTGLDRGAQVEPERLRQGEAWLLRGRQYCPNSAQLGTDSAEGWLIVLTEISCREEVLAQNVKQLEAVMARTKHVLWMYDLAEKSCRQILGSDEVWELDLQQSLDPQSMIAGGIVHPEDAEAFWRLVNRLKGPGGEAVESLRLRRRDGGYGWLQISAVVVKDAENRPVRVLGSYEDIDGEKKREIAMRNQAEVDVLTGLLNRKAMAARTDELAKSGESYALYMIDIDNFKAVNDRLGHSRGDKALISCANRLCTVFEPEGLVGRLGGDEFVALLPCPEDESLAFERARNVCDALRFDVKGVPVSASVGIAISSHGWGGFQELYERADQSLYRAKSEGKDRYALYDISFRREEGVLHLNEGALIDELDEIVYIADVETYELIYVNRTGRRTMGYSLDNYYGKKCYKAIQNLEEPCPFCTNDKLCYEKFYEWEFTNQVIDRHFLLKDKLVNWNGRKARLELAVDITQKEQISQKLSRRLEIEQLLVGCIRVLFSREAAGGTPVERLLCGVGDYYQAKRAYVLGIAPGFSVGSCEWCSPGQASRRSNLQALAAGAKAFWGPQMALNKPLLLEYTELLEDAAPVYVMPFGEEDVVQGCVVVEAPKHNLDDTSLLSSITYFIAAEIARSEMDSRLKFMKRHDRLTGLPNRNCYAEYITRAMGMRIDQLGVVVADINGLKRLNRDLGYSYGDSVVGRVAKILSAVFLPHQVYRMSGDEFVVLCDSLDEEAFLRCCAELKRTLSKVELGVSIGFIWRAGDDMLDVEGLVRQADERMVYEKRSYYRDEEIVAKRRIPQQEKQLKAALSDQRFFALLQPKAELSTGRIVGAEALVRYRDQVHGLVMPDKFIPMLEGLRAIHLVDLFVLERACKILSGWKAAGQPMVPISVNFSRSTLIEPDITERIERIADNFDLPRGLIEFEVTESFSELETDAFAHIGGQIKRMGFSLALDDYGSRYSNASLMTRFPMDMVKIDRKIICELEEGSRANIVVRNMIQMCRDLDIQVVAEGVETRAQCELLREMKCRYAQGYYFGRPMAVEDFHRQFLVG